MKRSTLIVIGFLIGGAFGGLTGSALFGLLGGVPGTVIGAALGILFLSPLASGDAEAGDGTHEGGTPTTPPTASYGAAPLP